MSELTVADIRKAVEILQKFSIKPEPCGCIKYGNGVTLTCEAHTEPLETLLARMR